jgi:hypothetical protein
MGVEIRTATPNEKRSTYRLQILVSAYVKRTVPLPTNVRTVDPAGQAAAARRGALSLRFELSRKVLVWKT